MRIVLKNAVLRKFALSHFLLESQFWFPVWMLFLTYKGFDLTTMVLADGVFRFTMVALEYPLGLISDRIGRKKTYIIINLLAFVTYAGIILINGTIMLFSVWIVWGIFWAFSSGASSAYCYELTEKEGLKHRSFEVFGTMRATSSAASLFSHLLAGFLFAIAPEWPFIVNGVFATGSLLIAFTLPKISFQTRDSDIKGPTSFRDFISFNRDNPTLFFGSILLAISLIYFWSPRILIQPLFMELEIKDVWISIVYFSYSLTGIIAGMITDRVRKLLGVHLTILGGLVILWLGIMWISWMPGKTALFFIPLMSFGYYLSHTVLEVLIHHQLENRFRASLFSAVSFLGGAFIILSRPGLGILADVKDSQYAFFIWTILGGIVVVASYFLIKKLPGK